MTSETTSPTALVDRPAGLIQSPYRSDIFVPFRQDSKINICGVFHIGDGDHINFDRHFWFEDVRFWGDAVRKFRANGYTVFQFTEYSSPTKWHDNFPEHILQGSLSASDFSTVHDSGLTQVSTDTPNAQAPAPATGPTAEQQQAAEIQRLQRELERLRQQQAAAAPPGQQQGQAAAPAAAPAADADTAAFFAFLAEQQRMMQAQNTAFLETLSRLQTPAATQPAAKDKPTVEFPSWDGSVTTRQDFIMRLETMQRDRFFATVTDWTRTTPGLEPQANYLSSSIIDKVPAQHRHIFSNNQALTNDGFAMFHRLMSYLKGNAVENQLMAITELAALDYKADDSTATYLARARGLLEALRGVTIDQFVTLFALAKIDPGLYPGTNTLFRQGDPALLREDLTSIELRLEREDRLRVIMGDSTDSVRRAKQPTKPKTPNPTEPTNTPSYPPSDKQIRYEKIRKYTADTTNCPGCFATESQGASCRRTQCFGLLTAGFILRHDPAGAKKILEDMNAKKRERDKGRRVADGDTTKTPAAPSDEKKEVVGSGKRATSAEQSRPKSYLDATKTTPAPSNNYFDDLASDSDDDEGYLIREDINNLNSSSPYCIASARRTAISSTFSAIAKERLHKMKVAIRASDEAVCCADSGATRHMFPDYNTFVSYHKCTNKTVQLGDSTELPILGYGSAKFSLNGHVVLVRNALHVPGLTDPLYSLRQHRFMSGCGFFSHYDSGAFLLFPDFSIKVDDSVDCLLNFKAIGRNKSKPIAYAEPRSSNPAFDSARPVHVIEPDDSDDAALSNIQYNIPVPKAKSSPKTTPTIPNTPAATPDPPAAVVEETTIVDEADLEAASITPLSKRLLSSIHHTPDNLPPIPPSYTPGACENRTTFDGLKLHKIFGCRKFRTQSHLISASKNASLLAGGELPTTIGDFASITMPNRGKTITKRRKFLDKVHLDIVFGDCMALGGYRYALLLVDVATRYAWIYGMQTVSSADIIQALESFTADTGTHPKTYHADFDQKLIGGAALRYINKNSRIIAAPARRQSSNGLVEATWKTIVRMARAYITEKQVGREFWYFAVRHAVIMINQIPGRLGRRLTTPFELVYGVKPDSSTWFELFSVGYFDHKTENSATKSNTETQTLAGIAVGRDDKSNTIRFYNPLTKSYYSPPVFKLDEGRLPVSHFPSRITFDGGLVCGLQSNNTDPAPEPFPPGTRVNVLIDGINQRGTIQNIPLPSSPLEDTAVVTPSGHIEPNDENSMKYTVLLDNNTTHELTFNDLLTPPADSPPVDPSAPSTVWAGIPSRYLHQDAKITLEHDGTYHKGYLNYSPESGFEFLVRRNVRSKKIDFRVPLPNFARTWTTLLAEETLLFGHTTVSSFLRPGSYNNSPSANHVSAKNLINPCPPSLTKALHSSNPDRHVWLDSYKEEKGGLEQLDVFERISKKQYLHLKRTGRIGKALPSMCVLVVKPDKDGNPIRAKSRIVVLGNFEDRYYTKSQRYAPVLKYSSLRLLCSKAVGDKRILQQGDCKNAFCHARLPDDELTVVRPPVGDPEYDKDTYWLLNKTLYGLRRSPHHWYNMFTKALKDMGLQPSLHDPCLFSGAVHTPDSPASESTAPVHVGIYVDDFVFYSTDPTQETRFMDALKQRVVVDFMGPVDWFLGTAFTWKRHEDGHLSLLLSQSAFTEFTAHRFAVDRIKPVPNMTPYRSGLPIDSIPEAPPDDPDQKRRTKVYQSIVGCINWLATCTRPDISPALTFLASYNQRPSHGHYQAALHALKYLYSTADYGISYHSNASNTIQAFNHFPSHHDKEAYDDATPPSPGDVQRLTSFSDACWGGQFGNSVPDGTPLELFKFRSISGYVICRTGGPISWKSIRQNRTSLSSCEAEIVATSECMTELEHIRHRAVDLDISDANDKITVYNDNDACVQWSASVTNKGTKHMNLKENYVREAHQLGLAQVKHIPGVINASDLFTKELKDAAHFRRCRDSMMVSRINFEKYGHVMPSHRQNKEDLPYYNVRSPQPLENYRHTLVPPAG